MWASFAAADVVTEPSSRDPIVIGLLAGEPSGDLLGAGLMTADLSRGHRVAAALESGNVWVNNYNFVPPGMPFGGSKHSGFGRENCKYSLEAYSEIKTTFVQL